MPARIANLKKERTDGILQPARECKAKRENARKTVFIHDGQGCKNAGEELNSEDEIAEVKRGRKAQNMQAACCQKQHKKTAMKQGENRLGLGEKFENLHTRISRQEYEKFVDISLRKNEFK